jgi:hypothetical protein
MGQAVTFLPFTTEAWAQSVTSPCGICGRKRSLGQIFSKSFDFSLSVFFAKYFMLAFEVSTTDAM